jgi:hypothetical protein
MGAMPVVITTSRTSIAEDAATGWWYRVLRGGMVAKRSQKSPRAPSPKRCKRSSLWPGFSSV